jgi:2',3'-cyclic-nucleotide 2'-phosphodiesterase (5'-nucleotidase family)
MPDQYTILHTNDFHNHLTSEQATLLKQRVAALMGRGLLLDAGDAISSGNITYKPGGEPILDVMSDIGYSAMTVGNREFHFSRAGFHSKLSKAKFPILCANVRLSHCDQDSEATEDHELRLERDPPVYPWRLFILDDGFRVIVFGITVPMITEQMLVRKVSAYVFDDPLLTAERLVPRLKTEHSPDMVVAMTHIGIRFDRLLAEQVEGIDLIIGGHTHVVLPEGERVGKCLIVQAGSHGRLLGTVEILRKDARKLEFTARIEEL